MLHTHRAWCGVALGIAGALVGPPLAAADPVATQGSFLVANRDLGDPNFARTVVLLVRRDAEGTLGLVINRPTEVEFSKIAPELGGTSLEDRPVFVGGPVSPSSFHFLVRSAEELDGSSSVFADVRFSGSKPLLARLLRESGGKLSFRVYAGISGWAPGQLEAEIARGDWLVRPGDADVVFYDGRDLPWRKLLPSNPRESARARGRQDPIPLLRL